MATGMSYYSLSFDFRVPHNTISLFAKEVCQAIIDEYGQEVVVTPTTLDGWREISDQFAIC